ncbi:PIN-like domain-containing protein, partial [Pantoea ananatis]
SSISKKINSTISELKNEIFGDGYNKTISRYTKLRNELEELFSNIEHLTQEFKEKSIETRNNKIDFFSNHDVIRDQIDELTIGRIGAAPVNQKAIDEINNQGKSRYKYKIGPGFEDAKDKKNDFYSYGGINYDGEYGDYYVWRQILDYVMENNIPNVVYVTNDAKSDFFFKIDGKVRGPNESLITEIKSKGVNEFILQSIDTFLHHANNYLNADIDDTVIDELTNASPLDYRYDYIYNLLTKRKLESREQILTNFASDNSKSFVLKASLAYYKKLLNMHLRELSDIR